MTCNCGLSLERWREIIGYHPLHFWQFVHPDYAPITSKCNTLVREYAWQATQSLGRADIRQAIDTAITRLTEYLDYSPYPTYREDTIALHGRMRSEWGSGCLRVRTEKGRLIALGVEKRDLVRTATWSDSGIDLEGFILLNGVPETYTVAIADDPDLNLDELVLVVNNEDRYPAQRNYDSWDCKWIRDYDDVRRRSILTVETAIVFTARAWLMAKPAKYEDLTLNPAAAQLNIVTTANLLDRIDVYRRYTEAGTGLEDAAAVLHWDDPCGCGECAGGSVATTAAIHDPATGEVLVNVSEGLCTCRIPDRVTIRYLAGDTACTWDEVVARLAVAEMTRTICQCDGANNEFTRWNTDRSRIASQGGVYQASEDSQNNPFGTREGHIQAWQRVKGNLLLRGFAL